MSLFAVWNLQYYSFKKGLMEGEGVGHLLNLDGSPIFSFLSNHNLVAPLAVTNVISLPLCQSEAGGAPSGDSCHIFHLKSTLNFLITVDSKETPPWCPRWRL